MSIQKHNQDAQTYEPWYFAPGEVILHVHYDPVIGLSNARQVIHAEVINFLGQASATSPWSQLEWASEFVDREIDSVLIFPTIGESCKQWFALVPLEMKNQEATQQELFTLVEDLFNDIAAGAGGKTLIKDVTAKYVLPNWLFGAAHHQGSTGGPGGPPLLAGARTVIPGFTFRPEVTAMLASNTPREIVNVAILDTAPSEEEFAAAKNNIVDYATHPLQSRLLKKLKIDYASTSNLRSQSLTRVAFFTLFDQHYEMPDHGLFVSGIIHTIASDANLYLYEVINRYGVGTYYTVAQALSQLISVMPGRIPLIINCSLVLDIPRRGYDLVNFFIDRRTKFFSNTVQSMKLLFECIAQMDKIILVAAAGNDKRKMSTQNRIAINPLSDRPPARFPSAYDGIISVGASPKIRPNGNDLASYTNSVSGSANAGFYTLGGDNGRGNGMLGVFICRAPKSPALSALINPTSVSPGGPITPLFNIQYTTSTSGWAHWCGTSFATPVITGLLADWWGGHANQSVNSAKIFLDSAATVLPGTQEKEIIVTQA